MQILKVRYRTNEEFLENFSAQGSGSLFCPSTTPRNQGEQLIVDINFPALPNRVMLLGRVRWWRNALPRFRVRAGCQVDFLPSEEAKVRFIEAVAKGNLTPHKRRHVRIPVQLPVRWRPVGSLEYREGQLGDISVGGAFLEASTPLPVGTEVLLDLTVPGSEAPISLAGKVAYTLKGQGNGIKFLYRNGGGSRRIREVLRRVQQHQPEGG